MNQMASTYMNELELLEGYICKSENFQRDKFNNLSFVGIYLLFDNFAGICMKLTQKQNITK